MARHLCTRWRTEFHVRRPLAHLPRPLWVVEEEAEGPAYQRGGHWRRGVQHCLFKYSLAGAGWFVDASGRYNVPAGSGFLCRLDDPAVAYGYPQAASEPWRFIFLAFCAEAGLVEALLDRQGPVVGLDPQGPAIGALLACRRPGRGVITRPAGAAAALVHQLLQELADAGPTQAVATPAAHLVARAVQRIEETIEEGVNVTELAAQLEVSPEHLARVFRSEQGVPPLRYIQRCRMRRAADLLAEEGWTVKAVAHQLHFDTPGHFARVFRRVTGMSPTAYQREPGFILW